MKFTLALALALGAPLVMAQSVVVEGKSVTFDAAPQMVNGTFMVPVRSLFEAIGADLRWRMDRDVIEGMRKGHKLELDVHSKMARVDGRRRDLVEAPFVQGGRTYAPLKFLAEGMGYMISMENGNFVLRKVN